MLNVDQILAEWKNDSKIDSSVLDKESLSLVNIHSKYLSYLAQARKDKRKEHKKLTRLEHLLTAYYKGEYNDSSDQLNRLGKEPFQKKILKSEVSKFVEADSLYQTQRDRVEEAEIVDETVTEILRMFNRLSFFIKNCIDWQQIMGNDTK